MNKKYKLTKLSDNVFNGVHPNNINEGYTKIGYYENPPKVGERFMLGYKNSLGIFMTSTVTEIVDEEIFKTLNSTYKMKLYEKDNIPKTRS
jgi:hypothetical protein